MNAFSPANDPRELHPDTDRELLRRAVAHQLFGITEQPLRLGRFQLLRGLGHGAMGTVYEALDEDGSKLALKVVSRFDGKALYRLKREFRSLCDVLHPNLVVLHELFIEPGSAPFFTMDLVPGVPFDSWVTAEAVHETRLRSVLRQLADAVGAIHGSGKLHCDLKPSNVLCTPEGRLVVLDFGLVSEWGTTGASDWQHSELAGTPAYLAPEQAAGMPASRPGDWYSVGVMLFEALTGRLPFEGSPLRVLHDKQASEAPDPRAMGRVLPDDLADLCVALLQRDPDRRAGLERVQSVVGAGPEARLTPVPDVGSRSVFVGRERELAVLQQCLEATLHGEPTCVLVSGRSGMGKTALLERFRELAAPRALVLAGRCHEQESVPYKVLDGVIDALSRHLKQLSRSEVERLLPRHLPALLQLFPVLDRVPGVAEAAVRHAPRIDARDVLRQGFAALKELLLRLTDHEPVVVMVDDMQWGDIDSARLLSSVLGSPDPPPLLFVGAYRSDDEQSEFLRAMEAELDVKRLWKPERCALGPLAPEAATALARELLDQEPEHAAAIAAEADGMPFFVAELARYFRTPERRVKEQEQRLSLEEVILDRAASLPEGAQQLLRVLSAAAGPLEHSVAFEAAGLASADRASLVALRSARLVRAHGSAAEMAETYHDRVRETVVRHLALPEVRALHASIADAMERHGVADVERLLVHHAGAGDRLRAGRTAVAAADAAVRKLAFNRAASLLQRAVEFLSPEESRSLGLYRRLGEALANAGRGAQSADAYLKAASLMQRPESTRMVSSAALQCWLGGKTEEALALTRVVFDEVGIAMPKREPGFADVAWQRVRVRVRGYRLAPASTQVTPAQRERLEAFFDLAQPLSLAEPVAGIVLEAMYLRLALASGDRRHALMAMMWEVSNTATLGSPRAEREAASMMPQLAALASELDTPYARFLLHFTDAIRLCATGRNFQDAALAAIKARDSAQECAGAFWERALATHLQLLSLSCTGSLAEYSRLTDVNLRDSTERDDRFFTRFSVSGAATAQLIAGRPAQALELLEGQRDVAAAHYTVFRQMSLLATMHAHIYAGTVSAAVAHFQAELALLKRSPLWYSRIVRDEAQVALARVALAAHTERPELGFRSLAERSIARLPRAGCASAGSRLVLAAGLCHADGAREAACELLQRSIATYHGAQAPLAALYAQHRLCEVREDSDGMAQIESELGTQGVADPAHWIWSDLPSLRPSRRRA